MAKSNFIVRGGANFNPLYQEFNKAQKKMSSFQKGISGTIKTIGVALGGLAVGKLIKDSTKAAMGVESSMDNIARNMGESSKAFNEWVNTQSKSLAMAKDEAYQYGSTFSNLLGSFITDAKETSDQTQELMKAAAIISSKTGRTYDDVANRIRSGMLGSTEAIEDLGVYTQVSMLESTEAFKKFAGNKSWAQLDFQTQQQIRLNAILEQSFKRYGDTLARTTQTKQQMFLATLKNIRLNLGQAFLPIYNVVLPALTSLASKIESITASLAAFTQALFGKTATVKQTQQQAGAVTELGDATEAAGKKAKGALGNFDELNQLNLGGGDVADSVVGGGAVTEIGIDQTDDGTGGAMGQMETKAQEIANKVRAAFNTLKDGIMENKDIIISAISGIVGAFISFEVIKNWGVIVKGFKDIVLGLKGAFDVITITIGGISVPVLAIAVAIGVLIASIVDLWQKNEGFRNSVIAVWEHIKTVLTTIATDTWNVIKSVWDKYGATLINNLKEFIGSIQAIVLTTWDTVIKPIIENALNMLSWLWEKHLKGVVEQVGIFIMQLVNGALELWNKFFAPLIDWLVTILGPKFVATINFIVDKFGTLIAVIADVAKGILQILGGVIDFIVGVFTLNWEKAWDGVVGVFKGIVTIISGIFKGVLNVTIDVINYAIQKVVGGINGMIQGAIKLINKVPGIDLQLSPISVPKIPKLANGGVLTSPTVALLGEYAGAGSNPEIAAPQSLMYETVSNATSGGFIAVVEAIQRLENTLKNKNMTAVIGKDDIGKTAIDFIREQTIINGESPIFT